MARKREPQLSRGLEVIVFLLAAQRERCEEERGAAAIAPLQD